MTHASKIYNVGQHLEQRVVEQVLRKKIAPTELTVALSRKKTDIIFSKLASFFLGSLVAMYLYMQTKCSLDGCHANISSYFFYQLANGLGPYLGAIL